MVSVNLALIALLAVGAFYSASMLYLGRETLSRDVAQIAGQYPFVAVLWGVFWALTLPALDSWVWAACGVLTAHWFTPNLTVAEVGRIVPQWVGIATSIGWVTVSGLFGPWVSLVVGFLLSYWLFPAPVLSVFLSQRATD